MHLQNTHLKSLGFLTILLIFLILTELLNTHQQQKSSSFLKNITAHHGQMHNFVKGGGGHVEAVTSMAGVAATHSQLLLHLLEWADHDMGAAASNFLSP